MTWWGFNGGSTRAGAGLLETHAMQAGSEEPAAALRTSAVGRGTADETKVGGWGRNATAADAEQGLKVGRREGRTGKGTLHRTPLHHRTARRVRGRSRRSANRRGSQQNRGTNAKSSWATPHRRGRPWGDRALSRGRNASRQSGSRSVVYHHRRPHRVRHLHGREIQGGRVLGIKSRGICIRGWASQW